MEAPLDLYHASRDELVALIGRLREQTADQGQEIARLRGEIATQQAVIVQLSERVGALRAILEPPAGDDPPARPTGMPGLKPAGRTTLGAPEPRARTCRQQGYGRQRMVPTARQVHAYDLCPHCATKLRGGTIRRRREVIELVPARVEVTEHVYVERRCPRGRGRWLPGPGLTAAGVGQGRLGVGIRSLIAVLREELRLPVARLQWYLATVHGLRLSVGAIVDTLHTVAARAAPLVAQLQERVRASPVLHADETGWREDGANGYVWTFSTETARVFVRGTRERAVLEAVLGPDYAGVLVSDFYAAYTSYAGRHQYCWAHLLRDVDEVVAAHRADATVRGWADGVHAIYQRARAASAATAAARRQARQAAQTELRARCTPFIAPRSSGWRRHRSASYASASTST